MFFVAFSARLTSHSLFVAQLGLNYIDVLNTDAFLSDGNPQSSSSSSSSSSASASLTASSDKKAQSSPAVALVLKQFAEQDFRIRYHAMHLLEVFLRFCSGYSFCAAARTGLCGFSCPFEITCSS
jgi:hypothetical protein